MMTGVTTSDELLAAQDELQAEAVVVHADLQLGPLLGKIGEPTMPARLDPDSRTAILQIKHAWAGRDDYGTSVRSYDVYRSVLDHGVRTPEQFDLWRESLPH
jgi:hypothetical protein